MRSRPARPVRPVAEVRARTPWAVKLFILSLMLPTVTSINIGTVRLSPYRLVLLLLVPYIVHGLTSGKAGRIRVPDILLILGAIWAAMALFTHHGMEQALEPSGVNALELLGSYFLARVCINTLPKYRATVGFLFVVLLLIMPLAAAESLTGTHVIQQSFCKLLGTTFNASIDPRFGLHRAFGPFDHPILWGVFGASCVSMFWFRYSDQRPTSLRSSATLVPIVCAITSVSSGAIAALMVQFMLIAYERLTRTVRSRWTIFLIGFSVMYVVIDSISNRSGLQVLLHYLTFSGHTAYNRIIIWEWGFWHNVMPNPVFGIGQNVWTRPVWMHSTSMDNFWLVQMVQFGLPAFAALAIATLLTLFAVGRTKSPETARIRLGYLFSMIGLIIAGCTVHYWNTAYVWLLFLLGVGRALVVESRPAPAQPRPAPARVRPV